MPTLNARRALVGESKMRAVLGLVVALVVLAGGATSAAVWNEPWHREIVLEADSFGLFEPVDVTPLATTFRRIKGLAGADTGEAVVVDGFYGSTMPAATMVRSGQTYDDEWTLRFQAGRRYYLFLKRAPATEGVASPGALSAATATGDAWRIATPTGGLAQVQADGSVVATYRHSLHQALVDAATFELTQTCIFDSLHRTKPCVPEVYAFIDAQLGAEPASLAGTPSPETQERFFRQHAALETAYLIGYSVDPARLRAFLESAFFHTQISAVRALARLEAADRNAMLGDFVMDDTRNPLARVFAVMAVYEANAVDLKGRLAAYLPNASTEPVGLGASLTDSRIGTRFPRSLQEALNRLLAAWE